MPVDFCTRLHHRIGNPLEWNSAEKASLLLALYLFLQLSYLGLIEVFIHADSLRAYVNQSQAQTHAPYFRYLPLPTLALSLGLYLAGKRWQSNTLYEHVASQYFAISHVYYGFCIGIVSLPVGTVLAGAPVVGHIFLHRRAVTFASINSLLLIVVICYFTALGELPYAPLMQGFPVVDQQGASAVFITYLVVAMPHQVMLFGFAFYVLQRWRVREEEVRHLSRTDSLTGLLNRGSIIKQLELERASCDKKNAPLAVLMLDLDHFKTINDTWGHVVGDQALVQTANTLRNTVRQNDFVGRYGGEEFLIILPGLTADAAKPLAQRILNAISEIHIDIAGNATCQLASSLGLSYHSRTHSASADDLLKQADDALYKAKNAGRNRLEVAE